MDSDQVAVEAVKLAEDNDQVIVRVQELTGVSAKSVKVAAATSFRKAAAVTGLERSPQTLKAGASLALDFKPYQLRSLALSIQPPAKLPPPGSTPVPLAFNVDAFSYNEYKQDGSCDFSGFTIPAEMIRDTVVSEGVQFQIGPRANGRRNTVSCSGQKVALPKGEFDRLYLLACSINGDAEGVFTIDGNATTLSIQDWSGYIGSWDNREFVGVVPERTYSVNNPLAGIATGYIKRDPLAWYCSHRHQRDGSDEVYKYSYLFKYTLPLPPGAKTLTLPDHPRIRVFAVTAVRNDNADTQPAQPLYDDFTGREPITLRADR
jgi:alpha-mannosidase